MIRTAPTTPIGTLDELEPILRARGFSHVRTMAGPMDLAEFNPYGIRRPRVFASFTDRAWVGTILEIEGETYLADAREASAPFLRGLFPLLTPSQL